MVTFFTDRIKVLAWINCPGFFRVKAYRTLKLVLSGDLGSVYIVRHLFY